MRTFDYLSLSQKSWDMDILNLVAKIREHKGRQDLYIKQKPAELSRMTAIARIQSTEASNEIEGIITTGARLKQLMEEKTKPRNRDEREILGYRDVLNTIHENYSHIPIKPSYILQLHRDLLKRSGLAMAGKYKAVQNYIIETRADGTSFTRFTPAAPHETESAVNLICAAYEKALASELIDPLILIPVFIADFLCIHPFSDGNGRLSRLMTLLLLYQSGHHVGKYISIEKEIELTKDRYYEALERSNDGWHEGKNAPVPFIRYMLQIILSAYIKFEERIGDVKGIGVQSTAYEIAQHYVKNTIGAFTGADAVVNCPSLSRSSVLAALSRMVSEGYLVRLGAGRSTRYVRADKTEQ
ncbi:MAG: Fic family protein [Bacillota bacterium]|nr:Fic family protein [Bacillota bacterium]